MNLKVLIVTATPAESASVRNIKGIVPSEEGFRIGNCAAYLIVTGVGSVATAWAMKQWLSMNYRPDLILNAGIAGSYREDIVAGDLVMPLTDCFADLGVETPDGFMTLSEAGLREPGQPPFRMIASNRFTESAGQYIRPVNAITVNTVTGSEASQKSLVRKYNPDIETMEGAAFFYICTMEDIPFLAVRAVSNKVGPRNRKEWNIPLALDNLSAGLGELLLKLE